MLGIEITMGFGSQKLVWIHTQSIDYSNFDPLKTTFLLTTFGHVSW